MTQTHSKAELFSAMGLGPVWELKNANVPAVSDIAPGLDALRSKVFNCRACALGDTRKQAVFADGVPNAPLMVVGEAPGEDEDASGLPFVGRAGQLLDRILQAVGANRASNVYISNVLKCHPPGNRDPKVGEIEQCTTHLLQQIEASQPKVLLLVGRVSIQTLLNTKKPVGELRGSVHNVTLNGLNIPAVVTYHPAYLMRKPDEKAKVWDDLLLLKQLNVF